MTNPNKPSILEHSWNVSIDEATTIQETLRQHVSLHDTNHPVNIIAGTDVAYHKQTDQLVAAIVLLNADDLSVIEKQHGVYRSEFPYVPGLFSFRELPPLLRVYKLLTQAPDLIVCDAQGVAHPRRFGLASHLGVLLDKPTIGCGKTHLYGDQSPVHDERFSKSPLIDQDETIGYTLRTQTGIKPVFVSAGHNITHESACDWVLKLCPRYRLPETTRQADQYVNQLLKSLG